MCSPILVGCLTFWVVAYMVGFRCGFCLGFEFLILCFDGILCVFPVKYCVLTL